MDNRAQISIEYLVLLAVALVLAALATLLAFNIFSIKEGLKEIIETYRGKFL
jgi:uncharacterized protein (UPF0333 family)